MKTCQIWAEECDVAMAIEAEFGTEKALSYLIGEKFLDFLDASKNDLDFQAEIPAFVAEIKTNFERWQLAEFLERQLEPIDPTVCDDEETADFDNQWAGHHGAAELLLMKRAKEWLVGEGK